MNELYYQMKSSIDTVTRGISETYLKTKDGDSKLRRAELNGSPYFAVCEPVTRPTVQGFIKYKTADVMA